MTQFQFEMICKIIENGAPVLAKELCGALSGLVQTYNATVKENKDLKEQLAAITVGEAEKSAN
jgi:hypothetical protein